MDEINKVHVDSASDITRTVLGTADIIEFKKKNMRFVNGRLIQDGQSNDWIVQDGRHSNAWTVQAYPDNQYDDVVLLEIRRLNQFSLSTAIDMMMNGEDLPDKIQI